MSVFPDAYLQGLFQEGGHGLPHVPGQEWLECPPRSPQLSVVQLRVRG